MKKRLAWSLAGALLITLVLAGGYLSRFRPVVLPLPVAQVDAVSQKTGLADCFWVGVSAQGGLVAYPDTGAAYWMTQMELPAGASLEFLGEFPHARHVSFNVYDQQGQPLDRLNDFMIEPHASATNPYRVGARRDAALRGYTIRLATADLKAGEPIAAQDRQRPVNTLFVPAGQQAFRLWMRIYAPDHGQDAKGGVPLPKPTLKLADGTTVSGEALCRQIVRKEGAVVMANVSRDATQTLLQLGSRTSPYHPAQEQPRWFAFYNPAYAVVPYLYGTQWEWLASVLGTQRKGGFFSTLDNTYMATLIDHRWGDVLLITGNAPKTPATVRGATVMAAADLRYWSLCQYHSLHDPSVQGCVFDEQVHQDKEGHYAIAISTAANRPANARTECGVTWMDWGQGGDGVGNPAGGMLVYRQMLPTTDFKHSLFETRVPGDEEQALGDYFPHAHYLSKFEFDQRPCREPSLR